MDEVFSEMKKRKVTFKVLGEDFFLSLFFRSMSDSHLFFESENVRCVSRGTKHSAELHPGNTFLSATVGPSLLFHP